MKKRDLDRFFRGKLKLRLRQRRRHDDYQVLLHDGSVPLPSILTLSRKSGEVSLTNLKGLASNLGLSIRAFKQGPQCHIGRKCTLYCIAGRLLCYAMNRSDYLDSSDAYDIEMVERLCESATMIITEANLLAEGDFSKVERKELKRLCEQIQVAAKDFKRQHVLLPSSMHAVMNDWENSTGCMFKSSIET